MRENAAVLEEADRHRPSPVALLPIALVAVVVVVLALVVAGNQTGTIVIQRIAFSAAAIQNGKRDRPTSFSITEITQTAADGTDQRDFTSNTFGRPAVQEVTAGQQIEAYLPGDNTIYLMTQAGLQRAFNIQDALAAPKGAHVGRGSVQHVTLSSQLVFTPGRRSTFAQQLHAHQYRVAGRATIDSRPALTLLQTRRYRVRYASVSGGLASQTTVYVTPRTYDPIEEVIRSQLPGASDTVVERWSVYRVLRATARNQRLLSLSAQHPHARVVNSALAYLRANQAEQRSGQTRYYKPQTKTSG
jgi:hypothetical protein